MSQLNGVSYQLPAALEATAASSGLRQKICQMLLDSGAIGQDRQGKRLNRRSDR